MAGKIKIPKMFQKEYTEKLFEKKILKRLYVNKDKEFIQKAFSKDAESKLKLKAEITEEEAKQLKKIADAVKKNSAGVADTGKLALLAVVVALVLIFNFFFKNWLVTKGLEAGLQAIFNAKAEVTGVDFDIPGAKLAFKQLSVADESRPMKNLFELGTTVVKLNGVELLTGKIIAEKIECQTITWNTDRKTSGALAKPINGGSDAKADSAKKDNKPLLDFSNIDVNKVMEEQKTNLQSLKMMSNVNTEISGTTNGWDKSALETKKKIAETSKAVDEVKKINVNNIKTAADAQEAYSKINKAMPAVDSLKNDVDKNVKDISDQKNKLDQNIKTAQSSVDKDYQYLLSAVNLPKGGLKGLASSMLEQILALKLGKFYFYGLKARTILASLNQNKDGGKNKVPAAGANRAGYDVPFPTKTYPHFLIQILTASVGAKTDAVTYDAYLKDLSSDADLWGKPATFHLGQMDNGKGLQVDGFADSRSNTVKSLGLSFEAVNYPFSFSEGLESLGAKSAKGTYRFIAALDMNKDNSSEGQATITLTDVDLELSNPDDFIGKLVQETVSASPNITIDIDFSVNTKGSMSMNVRSSLDDLLSKKMSKVLGDTAAKAEKELKAALLKQLEPEMKKNAALSGAMKQADDLTKGNLKDVNALKAELDKKKKEIDDKLNASKKEAEDKVKKEAENKLKDATKTLPKIPGF